MYIPEFYDRGVKVYTQQINKYRLEKTSKSAPSHGKDTQANISMTVGTGHNKRAKIKGLNFVRGGHPGS